MRGGLRNKMPEQASDIRNKNFDEVALGYSLETAIDEAQRCLNCKNPKCVQGCPVNVDIPDFISALKDSRLEDAVKILKAKNTLPAVCGRVCPQESQCEKKLHSRHKERISGNWQVGAVCCRLRKRKRP